MINVFFLILKYSSTLVSVILSAQLMVDDMNSTAYSVKSEHPIELVFSVNVSLLQANIEIRNYSQKLVFL